MANAKSRSFEYRDDIDGLRAISIIPVVLFHAMPSLMPGGFIGVDVFFAISGYLIAGIMFREVERGNFEIGKFYRRRVRRIFPALILVLATCLAVGVTNLFDKEFLQVGTHTLFGTFGAANFSLYYDNDYFALSSEKNPLLHLWSLGVEEQFYLFLPFAVFLFKQKRNLLISILIAVFVTSLILSADVTHSFTTEEKFYLPHFRAWEILAGVLLAYYFQYSPQAEQGDANSSSIMMRNALSMFAVVLLVIGFSCLNSETSSFVAGLFAIVGALTLIGVGPDAWVNRYFFSNKVMVFIGLISYPLYLWHWPLISFSKILFPESTGLFQVGTIAMSFALAFLTWKYVEVPIRSGAARIKSPAPLVAVMVCIALISGYVVANKGMLGWAMKSGPLAFMSNPKENDLSCVHRFWGESDTKGIFMLCSNADANSEPDAVVIGDSHAYHLFSGLNEYYSSKKKNIVSFTALGCPPNGEPPFKPDCVEIYEKIFEKIAKLDSVKTVVFGEYVPYIGHTIRPHWTEGMRDLIRKLSAKDRKFVLMLDVPQIDHDPRECYIRPLSFSKIDPVEYCSTSLSLYDQRVPTYREQAAEAALGFGNVVVFDLPAHLCGKERCNGVIDGRVIYRDRSHLNYFGSMYLAQFYNWEP